ncbi:hypothetical protein [Mesorhizobium sp. KR2-14]|uniref:hypothetical protein n=1 Tax=Mesorhizobium sp. KR2-14 TaxID=3156610 RepID=UPI0032B44BF6
MNMASLSPQALRASGRPSRQTRGKHPYAAPRPHKRATEMAETMREILYRDGNITDEALVREGYTTAELIEFGHEAIQAMTRELSACGQPSDRVPAIIEKAIAAAPWIMPTMASTPDTHTMRLAWRDYCTANAAHRIDPWVSQAERCLCRLKIFLGLLPLLPREANTILQAVAAALKRRVPA